MGEITQESNFEILEKLPDGNFKIKYPKVKSKSGVTFDEHLADNANKAHGGFKGALVALAANQSIPNTTSRLVTWTKVIYNDLNIFNVADPTKLMVPPGVTKVRLHYAVNFGSNTIGYRESYIRKNNTGRYGGDLRAAVGMDSISGSSSVLQVKGGDYFGFIVHHKAGVALDVLESDTTFAMEVIE